MMKKNNSMILQLQTLQAVSVGFGNSGLTQFRKEVIKVGKYVHPATKKVFEVTIDLLNHWVSTFNRWIGAGNQVPIPLGHSKVNNPESNAGWVTALAVEEDSLFGIMELSDPKLSLTTDVSLCVDGEVTDGKGNKYTNIITHIALCTDPVIAGLGKFMKLSLSKGETDMKFLKKIAEALGIKDKEPTEELVLSALKEKVEPMEKKQELSQEVTDPVVKLVSENRAIKLANLVKAGLITPAIKDVITAQYVETKALALSMASKQEDGFDLLYKVLAENKSTTLLDEQTGVQSLELANQSTNQPNVMKKEVDKRREAAGLKTA